jgi:hypothetical protein
MPAKPNDSNPRTGNPLDILDQFQDMMGKAFSANAPHAWWNHVDRGLLEWPGHEMAAANTGLFFHAAQSDKTVYTFAFTDRAMNLPKDCENSVQEGKKMALELLKEMDSIEGLRCIQCRRYFSEDDKSKAFKFYANENTACTLTISIGPEDARKVSLDVRSYDIELVEKLQQLARKYVTERTADPQLYAVSEDDEGRMVLVSIGKPGIELERGNYNEEVLAGFDYVVKQLNSEKPFGRLVIMYGPPGTGKTHLLRGMFSALNLEKSKFIFLQPEFLFKHSVSALTRLLLDAAEDGDSLILLIEDADDCLVPRQQDNMVAISTLLNLADGFIGNMLDIRVIATTNASKLGIDNALKRPGRLCRIMEVGLLSTERANVAVKRITGEDGSFKHDVVLAEVYAAAAEKQGNVIDVGKIPTASLTGVGFAK